MTYPAATSQPHSEPASLGVVIVAHNSADVLPGLLDTLHAGLAGVENHQIVVVDNQSRDESATLAEAHPIGATVLRAPSNGGYSAGINLAATLLPEAADMLVLNPDIRLLPGSILQLVERARDERVGVAVPKIRNYDGSLAPSLRREPTLSATWWHAALGPNLASRLGLGEIIADPAQYQFPCTVDWATGAILLVAARARRRIGPWDESFFLYSEEVDYQRQVRHAGLDIAYVPEAEVFHGGGAYQQSVALTSVMTSNKIRYFARYHGTMATTLFRAALAAFGLLRVWRSGAHRSVLKVALSPLRPPRHYMNMDQPS